MPGMSASTVGVVPSREGDKVNLEAHYISLHHGKPTCWITDPEGKAVCVVCDACKEETLALFGYAPTMRTGPDPT